MAFQSLDTFSVRLLLDPHVHVHLAHGSVARRTQDVRPLDPRNRLPISSP